MIRGSFVRLQRDPQILRVALRTPNGIVIAQAENAGADVFFVFRIDELMLEEDRVLNESNLPETEALYRHLVHFMFTSKSITLGDRRIDVLLAHATVLSWMDEMICNETVMRDLLDRMSLWQEATQAATFVKSRKKMYADEDSPMAFPLRRALKVTLGEIALHNGSEFGEGYLSD